MNRSVKVLTIALFIIGSMMLGIRSIVNHYGPKQSSAVQTPNVPAPAGTSETFPSTTVPTTTTDISPGLESENDISLNSSSGAVTAAAGAINRLSRAQLLPDGELRETIDNLVVPSKRSVLIQAYHTTGPMLAQQWGYASTDTAMLLAGYDVRTLKFRVLSYSSSKATVALYTMTHWVTSQSVEYWVPAINIVKLTWSKNRWLYIESADPPADQAPMSLPNLTLAQTQLRFLPYVEDFNDFQL